MPGLSKTVSVSGGALEDEAPIRESLNEVMTINGRSEPLWLQKPRGRRPSVRRIRSRRSPLILHAST